MITRDSKLWWLAMAGAVLTGISGQMGVFHAAFPDAPAWVDAQITFWSMIIGILSGVARMSPLPISPEGRSTAIQKNALQADTANIAATVAAVKADVAAQATAEASKAADVASAASDKAADVP